MGATVAASAITVGFLTVQQDPKGYVGGYLVTNQWGRPLEFRLSTAVQPNKVQEILYAQTLQPYICGDLIGKTLVEKTGCPVRLVVTDTPAALDLRHKLEVPVLWLAQARRVAVELTDQMPLSSPDLPCPTIPIRQSLHCHGDYPGDVQIVEELLDGNATKLDFSEPFFRVREAMGEAKKLGVGARG
ncbi:MAG: hypothetical protein ACFCD0_01375 [Gemmataceae bacterium]